MPSLRPVYTLETMEELAASPVALYAVLGDPVAHSLSPTMQEAGFQAAHLDARYIRLHVTLEELPAAVARLKALNFRGWNCTIPHKENMFQLVDHLAPSARQAGAVNTVVHDQGILTGHSTDAEGFLRAIAEEFGQSLRDLRVMILGTGGAGRSLAQLCALAPCRHLTLVNRTPARARELAEQLPLSAELLTILPWDENQISEKLAHIDLLINATSVGLQPTDASVLSPQLLSSHLLVYDTMYRPTPLIEAARAVGARWAGGLSMLLYQGAASFSIWTGRPAPVAAMRQALAQAAGISF
jgi:shikimate dehydrogenase